MAQAGSELVNASITAGGTEVTLGPYLLDGKISVGIDGDIINDATPPASVPLVLVIEYNRATGLDFLGFNFQGSLTANGLVPIRNMKIPYDAYSWRVKYTPAPDQNVTLKLFQGGFTP